MGGAERLRLMRGGEVAQNQKRIARRSLFKTSWPQRGKEFGIKYSAKLPSGKELESLGKNWREGREEQ